MKSPVRLFRFVIQHPIGRKRKIKALLRILFYQLYKRISSGSIIFRFTGNSKLILEKGMTGATGNYYCGLHEFEDMSFLLHFLRPEDLFIDIGANVGSYTVLASAEAHCNTIVVEPIPYTFERLLKNISINHISEKVKLFNVGLGKSKGNLNFTTNLDTGNHVVDNGDFNNTINVEVTTLDELVMEKLPSLIKMDVEGYEWQVLEGGKNTLQSKALQAMIIERYDPTLKNEISNEAIEAYLKDYGFYPFSYDPWIRELKPGKSPTSNNTLFIRGVNQISERVKSAPAFEVFGIQI